MFFTPPLVRALSSRYRRQLTTNHASFGGRFHLTFHRAELVNKRRIWEAGIRSIISLEIKYPESKAEFYIRNNLFLDFSL